MARVMTHFRDHITEDEGHGPRTANQSWRFLNRDGSINVDNRSFKRENLTDLYHILLSIGWGRLLAIITSIYLLMNLFFGTAYFLAGPNALEGIGTSTGLTRWEECFFFSVQTLATIGYGKVSPVSIWAHLLVTVEALMGLMGLAVMTGIVYSRFSRPTARVRFSDRALLTRIAGKPCLTFRMANARFNQIVEARVRVVLSRTEITPDGHTFRELYDLKLERDRSPLFAMTWTVIHWIDDSSPLYHATRDFIVNADSEVIVALTGTDETFSQTIHARFSYGPEDIAWNLEFEDVLSFSPEGRIHVALECLSATRVSERSQLSEPIE